MKIRTDFVTNSSDASYVAFNIKNKKLFDYLTGLGLKFSNSEEGSITDETVVTLSSGEKRPIINRGFSEAPDYPYDYSSHSAWVVANMLAEVTKEQFYYDELEYSSFTESLLKLLIDSGILNQARDDINKITRESIESDISTAFEPFDKYTEYGKIEQTSGFEGEGGFVYEEIQNGERVEFYSGSTDDLEEEDLDEAWDVICSGGVKEFLQYVKEKEQPESSSEKSE